MARTAIAALRSLFARVRLVTPRYARATWLGQYARDALPEALRDELELAAPLSPHMLREAKDHLRSCRNVEFIEADFRSFTVSEQVDLVISSGDSLNYVQSTSELGNVFGCVAEALRPGGLFLFDLQNEQSFRRCSRVVTCFRSAQFEWVQGHAYDPETRIDSARVMTRVMTPEGVEMHGRMCLAANDVGEAARRAGMRVHERFDTPALRFFASSGGRDFYAFCR